MINVCDVMDIGLYDIRRCIILMFCYLPEIITYSQVIRTDKGNVRGKTVPIKGKHLDVFYGIPFARPPIGEYRFKHPQPASPWSGVYNATILPPSCMQQKDTTFKNFIGAEMWNPNTKPSEDCLYLNVWVPRTKTQNKAVMVWIYGGSFSFGSSVLDVYNAKYLAMENDVIVVSMQHRVGSFGFFAADTSEAPGNCGLFDQLMALEWVQKNIRAFGGSPSNVTLFAESSGAASIGMHLLSPLSRPKFHRAILQSGAPEAPWATISKEIAFSRGNKLAKNLNCNHSSPEKMVACLRRLPAEHFPLADFEVTVGITQFPFVPVVDGVFLPEKPEYALMNGNFKPAPLLLGSNTNEGSYFLVYALKQFYNRSTSSYISRKDFELSIKTLFSFYPQYPNKINSFVEDAIFFQYTPWIDPDNQAMSRDKVSEAVGDFNFVCPVVNFAEHYAKSGQDVYYYVFDHRSTVNPWGDWMGVLHGDEIMFVFGEPLDHLKNYTSDERKLSKKIMKFWTNFAKTGNPNKEPGRSLENEWPLHTATGKKYLHIDATYLRRPNKLMAVGVGPRIQECAFWREYVPRLADSTADMSEMERQWKIQFSDWRNKYMVEWKVQFESFVKNYERRLQSCNAP